MFTQIGTYCVQERLAVCSAAQLVLNACALYELGLLTPSGDLLIAWLEEVHTKRKGLTPLQTVKVLQVLGYVHVCLCVTEAVCVTEAGVCIELRV